MDPHSEQEKETARALYKLGNERYAQGDFRGALEAFLGAHRIMQVPTTGLGLGKAQERTGKLLDAQRTLTAVAQRPSAGADEPESFAVARQEASDLVDELEQRIPTLELRITDEDGSLRTLDVSLDGRALPIDMLAQPQRLDPGMHIVQVSAPGHVSSAKSVELAERERQILHIVLAKLPPPPPQPSTPRPDTPPPRSPDSPAAPEGSRIGLGMAVAGLSVATLGVLAGAVTGAVSLSAADKLKDECNAAKQCPPSAAADRDRSLTMAHVSTVSFAMAGLGVAVGIAGLVLELGSSDQEPVSVTLMPTSLGMKVPF